MEKARYPVVLFVSALLVVSSLYLNSLIAIPAARPVAEQASDLSASRYLDHVKYLASDELKGRGDGSPELNKAADYIASQFRVLGLRPMGGDNTYFQKFELTTGAQIGSQNQLELNGTQLKINDEFVPIPFSNTAQASGLLTQGRNQAERPLIP